MPMHLVMGMQHPVEAALRNDAQATIRQSRHDLSGRQYRKIRLIAGEQDSLAFFFAKAVRQQVMATITAILTIAITRKLTPPALQGGEPHAKQSSDSLARSIALGLSPVGLDLY